MCLAKGPLMTTALPALLAVLLSCESAGAQTMEWEGRRFEIANVTASLVELRGERVLKVERDLKALPFDAQNLAATVDQPTFVKVSDLNMENGAVEVKVLSRIQVPSPFAFAQGFIGLAFRVSKDNSAFESIYLRPNAGRSDSQFARNHTVQYFAYPDYKFDRLRKEATGAYETYADVGLDEWITMRIEFHERNAALYLNDEQRAAFVVNGLKGTSASGGIGLWVDIGTQGFFKDLRILEHTSMP